VNVTAQHSFNRFSAGLRRYIDLSGKTPTEAIQKQAGKFAFTLSRRLRSLAPAKRSVRAERTAALARGEGIKVRAAARAFAQKKTIATASDIRTRQASQFREKTKSGALKTKGRSWWEVAVAREISIRESSRGFLAIGARYPRTLRIREAALSRFGIQISTAAVKSSPDGAAAAFDWNQSTSELSGSAARGMNKRGSHLIALSLDDVSDDIALYVTRKNAENLQRALK